MIYITLAVICAWLLVSVLAAVLWGILGAALPSRVAVEAAPLPTIPPQRPDSSINRAQR